MIALLGLAGSGKGTQGRALAELFGWRWLSVGEALRRTGDYDDITKRGDLVPDSEVVKIMGRQIEKAEAEGFDVILDGFPRDGEQAKWLLDTMPKKLNAVIILEVPKEELFKRLALRGRNDDKERETIERRFEVFEQNIYSILPLLNNANIPVERVDGTGAIEDVTTRLVSVVKKFSQNAVEQINDVNGEEIERSYGE